MLQPIKKAKDAPVKDAKEIIPKPEETIPRVELKKKIDGLKPIGLIDKDRNYLYDLAELDKKGVLAEQDTRFLLAFGTSFHVFQYVRRVKGNTEALQILGDIDSILTNKVFIDSYEGLDKEILDTFWFNLSDASKYYIDELVSRLLLISK